MSLVYLINNREHRTIVVAPSFAAARAWLRTEHAQPHLNARGLYIVEATTVDHEGPEEWRQVFE